MSIPQEAIDAAAKATCESQMGFDVLDVWDKLTVDDRSRYRCEARIALEAAIPHIRKQIAGEIKAAALREAAAECWEGYEVTDNRGVYLWLERRAKELEGKP